MTFDPTAPQATTSPATFPAKAQANWAQLQKIVEADHQFNNTAQANDGYHNLVHMQIPVTPPSGALASLGRLYVKTAGSFVQLFYMDSNGREHQITPGILAAVNFNGVPAVPVIRSQVNVSSVVKTSTGNYTVNFATPMDNNNYVVVVTGMRDGSGTGISSGQVLSNATYGNSVAVGSVKISFNGGSSSFDDVFMGNVIVYGMV